jgi:TonB family protein
MTDSPDHASPDSNFPERDMFTVLTADESRRRSFAASFAVNLVILGACLWIGMIAPRVIEKHYEFTELVAPIMTPPVKHVHPHLQAPRKPLPEPKPVKLQARLTAPQQPRLRPRTAVSRPTIAAAMPAQNRLVHPALSPVHLGDTFGATPNPNAMRPANVAALGNAYGNMRGQSVAPHGIVKSAGFGDSTRAGEGGGGGVVSGRVGSVGMPGVVPVSAGRVMQASAAEPETTSVQVISKPPIQYPAEARQSRIEGDVVLNVTFAADGQVLVHGVLRGLGHGLDQEAIRVAEQIRFRPATRNGRAVDITTHVTIAFQLA